ncbi:MAG: hypothetical protein GEU99_19985 [Luteitalea sp.]|nr:hypothetical protein [Luteitalea sp.]
MRTLPVTDRAIVASKLLFASALQVVTAVAGILLLLPALLEPQNLLFCPVLIGFLVTFGNLSILSRLRYGTRLGGALPFLILLIPCVVFLVLAARTPGAATYLVESVRAPATAPLWFAGEILLNVAMWLHLTRWMPSRDTSDLLE